MKIHRYLCALLPLALVTSAHAAKPPNIIIILADDMGYSDLGCYGGEIATPALDKLANEGIRLTRFRNGGMCVVSRTSMLTGQWWPQGVKNFKTSPLLSEKLQAAGYRTGLIGKWHLPGHPLDRGFDHFFGFLDGATDHFVGSKSYQFDRQPFTDFGPDYYSTDQFTNRSIDFIQSPSAAEKPFFLYLSYQAPHNPLQAPKADILKHRGKYLGGWQAIREARYLRQISLSRLYSPAVSLLTTHESSSTQPFHGPRSLPIRAGSGWSGFCVLP